MDATSIQMMALLISNISCKPINDHQEITNSQLASKAIPRSPVIMVYHNKPCQAGFLLKLGEIRKQASGKATATVEARTTWMERSVVQS